MFCVGNQSTKDRAEISSKRSGSFYRKMTSNTKNPYCVGLVNKYADDMPVWACVELMSFGDLKDLIEYYANQTGWVLLVDIQSLDRVRQLRNACAHGNAIINDLAPVSGNPMKSKAPPFITSFVINAGISKTSRDKKLSNPRVSQIVHLLYVYDRLVISTNTRTIRLEALNRLINERIPENKDFFQSNTLLTSTYHFFRKIVETIH